MIQEIKGSVNGNMTIRRRDEGENEAVKAVKNTMTNARENAGGERSSLNGIKSIKSLNIDILIENI